MAKGTPSSPYPAIADRAGGREGESEYFSSPGRRGGQCRSNQWFLSERGRIHR